MQREVVDRLPHPPALAALPQADMTALEQGADLLMQARHPVIFTEAAGKEPAAVDALGELASPKDRLKFLYVFDIQRYLAEQQYYVYTNSGMITGTWQPYVKHYAPNLTLDYGSRAAALWLDL